VYASDIYMYVHIVVFSVCTYTWSKYNNQHANKLQNVKIDCFLSLRQI